METVNINGKQRLYIHIISPVNIWYNGILFRMFTDFFILRFSMNPIFFTNLVFPERTVYNGQ